MFKFFHHLPLVIFTLIMPGVVFDYGLNFKRDLFFLLWHLIPGILIMGIGSLHLSAPFKAYRLMSNLKKSWFSREALAYMLFLLGILFQTLFPELRNDFWKWIILITGIFGLFSTIQLYRQSILTTHWPISIDFSIEGIFIGFLLSRYFVFNGVIEKTVFVSFLILLKLLKDIYISVKEFYQKRDGFWILPFGFAVIAMLIILVWKAPEKSIIIIVINSIIIRFKLFLLIENQTIPLYISKIRLTYLPEKYHGLF